MSMFYGILCVIGWAWTAALAVIFEREIIRSISNGNVAQSNG
jgi:hypothetical protein